MKAAVFSIAGSRRGIFLVLLAAAVMAGSWAVAIAAGPFEADPDYIYLLNALELLTLRAPAYYTHPGTPVELLGAIGIAMTWLVSIPWHGISGLLDQVLTRPEFYLGWINALFVLGVTASVVFFAKRVRDETGQLFPAIVGALSIFLPMSVLLAVHRVTPEPLLLAGGMVLAGLMASAAFAAYPQTRRFAIAVGAVIGFCIATKATAAPLLIAILLLRGAASRKLALAACLLAAVLLTLPVAPHYLEMTLWYVGLFTHRGGYGGGAAGVPGLSELLAGAATLVTAMPETFVCLALYVLVILANWTRLKRLPDNAIRVLICCALIVALNLLAVLKQPAIRYTIPSVPFLCLGNAIVAWVLFEETRWGRAACVAGLAALGAWMGFARIQHMTDIRAGNELVLQNAMQSGCLLAPYYETNLVQYKLFFGNGWTQSIYRDRLTRLYPDFVSYNIGALNFEKFSGLLTDAAAHALLARRKCVYLVGPPVARYGASAFPKNALSLVVQSPGDPREAVAVYALKPDWNKNP